MSFLKANRTVLLISDQALYIFEASAKNCQLIEIVPWDSQDFEQNVATIISKECNNNPVLILNDMVEQHYRKERVPKVGFLDKSNVVDRKLLVTFPSYPIRAALPLKEKVKKSEKKVAGDIYIFAATPTSDQFLKAMGAARKSSASISGLCLLPIESSNLVKKLSEKFFLKEKAKWTVFIGQHQSGGLRQIVTKNGELALTRMTPVSEMAVDPDLWISEVLQEFKATMSYLSRFGFEASDGLNLILIANEDLGAKFSDVLDTPCNFKSLTPVQASKSLGLALGSESDFFADTLHAAWAGTRNSFILPMKVKDLDSVSKPRQIVTILSFLLFLGLSFQIYQSFGYSQSLYANTVDIDSAVQKKAELDIQYQKEVKRKEELGFDIQIIQSSIAVKADFDKHNIDALDLFYTVGMALPGDMRFDKIDIQRQELKPIEPGTPEDQIPLQTLYLAKLQMSFPSTMDAEKGNRIVENLKSEIQKNRGEDIVKITKLLEDYQYSEGLVVEAGTFEAANKQQGYSAEILIEKRIK